MAAKLTGEKPVTPIDRDSLVGKHFDDVIHGSRLKRALVEQGEDPGSPVVARAPDEPPVSGSRLTLIMQGKRAVKRFTWPGSDIEAGIVVLTAEEIEEAAIAASEHLLKVRDTLDNVSFMERLQHETSVQIVWRAVIDMETGRPFALIPEELRQHLPTDVLSYLVEIYNDWQAQLSPLTHPSIPDAEALRIIEALKKNAKGMSLIGYDAASLRHLLRLWASLPEPSPSSSS